MSNYLGDPNASGSGSIVIPLAATGGDVLNASSASVFSLIPTASETITASVVPAGYEAKLIVTTSGATSYTITFGTGFKSTATLATGTTTAKVFVVSFVSNGSAMCETSRTTAM